MNLSGHRFLLLLFLICLPFNGVNSGIIGRPICQDDEYYDEERDVCLDDCGGLRCAVEQICSDRLDGYVGPRACKNKCYEDCDIKQFCNSKTGKCDPCSSICIDLRTCRYLCYDVYRNLPQTTTHTSMEMTTIDSTPADPTTSSEAIHLNAWVIAVSCSLLVLVILALAGVTAAVICRRKNNEAKHEEESTELMSQNQTNCENDSSIIKNDFRIVKSVRFDDDIVAAWRQTLESRQGLDPREICKAEIGYQLVNYLQQCNDENLKTARMELADVLQEQVQDLNKLKAAARNHTIDTFKSDSEEEILEWLKTGNAVRVEGSEAVESPEMLMMHGHVSAEQATAIIQDSICKCLCLCNDKHTALNPRLVIPKHIEELHVCELKFDEDTLKTIADASSIRALSVFLYFAGRTEYIVDFILKLPSLEAFGFRLGPYVHKDECNKLWKSLQTKGSIKCVIQYIDPREANEIDLMVNIISNVESLQELWVSFCVAPSNDVLERIAEEILKMPNIKTISVVGEQVPVNVAPFLKFIGDNSSISTVYSAHDTSQLSERLTASFKGKLVRVQSGLSSCFFTPLMHSRFLLTSVPLHIKMDLFNKYVNQFD